jgi:hypothetical protein
MLQTIEGDFTILEIVSYLFVPKPLLRDQSCKALEAVVDVFAAALSFRPRLLGFKHLIRLLYQNIPSKAQEPGRVVRLMAHVHYSGSYSQ